MHKRWLVSLQYFDHLMWRTDSLGKNPDAGKDRRQEEKGTTEDKMVEWHHWLDGYEFEQAPGVGEGQQGLACCSPWGCKESDMTERLNWLNWVSLWKPCNCSFGYELKCPFISSYMTVCKVLNFQLCIWFYMYAYDCCPTLCDPMDLSPPGSSAHGIFQARILQWAAIPSSRMHMIKVR